MFPCDVTAEVIPARSWTPRLVLIGVALGAVVVAAASVRSRTGTEVRAQVAQTPGPLSVSAPLSPADRGRVTGGEWAARQLKREGAARQLNPVPAPSNLAAQPPPSSSFLVPPAVPVRRHRIHRRFAHSTQTSAPILD